MPYNTRSVTRERNATRERNTAGAIAKNEVKCGYFTRSKVPKMDDIKDSNETRFVKTCKWYVNEIENKNTHNEKITIFNDFMGFLFANKKILDSLIYYGIKSAAIEKIINIHNTCENVRELSNNWHIWLTGRPIKIK